MSHKLIAAVWTQLETRFDINNIVRELIGQHGLASGPPSDEASFNLVLNLRVVFDLQRTCLQCSTPSLESRSRLLKPELLFQAILYIVQIKRQLFRSPEDRSVEYFTRRSLVAHVLLSGLRALSLQECKFPPNDIHCLQEAFNALRMSDSLQPIEEFAYDMCQNLIRKISDSNFDSKLSTPACGKVSLPDYSTGLYPLQDCLLQNVLEQIDTAVVGLGQGDEDRLCSYWTLSDVAWATEAGIIQSHVTAKGSMNNGESASDSQRVLGVNRREQYRDRKEILERIFAPSSEDRWCSSAKASIGVMILGACAYDSCTCWDNLDGQSDSHGIITSGSSALATYRRGKPDTYVTTILVGSLEHFRFTLNTRREEMQHCNGEIGNISDRLNKNINNWLHKNCSVGRTETGAGLRTSIYILSCPDLHPVPENMLENLMGHSGRSRDIRRLLRSDILEIDINCGVCGHRVNRARRIEPLCYISDTLQEERGSTQNEHMRTLPGAPLQQATGMESPTDPPSSPNVSVSRSGSSAGSHISRWGAVPIPTWRFSLTSSTATPAPLSHSFRSYCFSSDGCSLLLWNDMGKRDRLMVFDIESGSPNIFSVTPEIEFAAAGKRRSALVSFRESCDKYLDIYDMSNGDMVDSCEISNNNVFSIAFSRCDKFVMIGFGERTAIYNAVEKRIDYSSIQLPDGIRLDSQKVNFSVDSNQAISATRDTLGVIHIHLQDLLTNNSQLMKITNKSGYSNDFGLSSILYDNKSGFGCVASYATHCTLVRFPKTREPLKKAGLKIQSASQSPTGSWIALVNEQDKVFKIKLGTKIFEKVPPFPRKRKSINNKGELMAIAMPSDTCLHLFWIHAEDMILASFHQDKPLVITKIQPYIDCARTSVSSLN